MFFIHKNQPAMSTKLVPVTLIATIIFASFAFRAAQQPKPWAVPDKDAKTVNPVKSNASSIAAGKALWETHCSSCHGKKGLGDGTKAAQLKTSPSDFTKASFQSQATSHREENLYGAWVFSAW
jgi:cytochrome c